MGIVYDDDEGSTIKMRAAFNRAPRKYEDLPATKFWLTHYNNMLYLDFLSKHPNSTFQEKQQAHRELEMARRKMEYWARHPNFNKTEAENGATKLKRDWKVA